MKTQTLTEPSEQNLPFDFAPAKAPEPRFRLTRGQMANEAEKAWRAYVLGGSATVAIGSAAIYAYGVSVDEAAAAAAGWLGVTYVLGRLAVHLTNSIAQRTAVPEEPHVYPTWMMWGAGGILAGFVCEFLAATVALSAGMYAAIPLSWAIHPALVICGVLVSVGSALLMGSLLFSLLCAGALQLLLLAVEYEFLRLAIFVGVCGGSYRATQLAPVYGHHRRVA